MEAIGAATSARRAESVPARCARGGRAPSTDVGHHDGRVVQVGERRGGADHVTCHVIDLVGSGSSEFSAQTPMSFENHIRSVRSVVDQLGLNSVAVVGHDSGGLISRHAMAGDPRLRAPTSFTKKSVSSWRRVC